MDYHSWDKYIIQPIVNTVDKYKFDGVVLDFEVLGILLTPIITVFLKNWFKRKYNNFIRKLKDALGDKLLVVIVHPTNVEGILTAMI